jgi:TolB-like protein
MKNYQVSEELVRQELSLILEFEEIKNSQVLSRFIEFVVDKKLSGHEDEIKEYTIAVKGLGKPRDYNPQLDASVRIHAGRLRRILTQYYQEKGKDDMVYIDIPKGTYIPIFKTRNNGHNGELILPTAQPVTLRTVGPIDEIESQKKKPVLAILPFQNVSSDNSRDFFATSIGEQLSTNMARFQNISVISYFATSVYNAELKDLQEMKNLIHIDYALTGSVRFINEIMKLNVQLINTENGEIVFADTYTRHLTPENIFEIQDEMISQISNVIADDNGIIMNKAYSSPLSKEGHLSTQEAIFKYFEYSCDYSAEKFQRAIDSLEIAIQTEPKNALALALLAGLYMDSYITNVVEDRALLEKAVELVNLAVDLDPLCQHAQRALAWSYLLLHKKEKSFETIEKCIKMNPSASGIIATMALAYICQGDYIRGFKWLLEGIHLNPTRIGSSKFSFCLFYFHTGNYYESLRWLERISPLETPFLQLLGLSLYGKMELKKKAPIDDSIFSLEENARSILDRMIFDDTLKTEIINGLQVAGLPLKPVSQFS